MTLFRVNLIRRQVMPIRRRRLVGLFAIIGGAAWCVPMAFLFVVWAGNTWRVNSVRQQLRRYQEDIAAVRPLLMDLGALEQRKDELQQKLTEVNGLLTQHSRWAEALQSISESLPDAAWVSEIRADSHIQLGAAGSIAKQEDATLELRVVAWDNASTGAEADDPLTAFVRNLERHPLLRKDIKETRLVRSERGALNGRPVKDMTFVLLFRPNRVMLACEQGGCAPAARAALADRASALLARQP